uniref:Tftc-3 n=1 Tax=Pristionchus pacificus TaxID=54126 RepID=A0A2A6C8S1_PRIPA
LQIMDESMDTGDESMQNMYDMTPMRPQEDANPEALGYDVNVGGVDVAAHFNEQPVPSTSHDAGYDEALARFMRAEIDYDEFMRQAGGTSLGEETLEADDDDEEEIDAVPTPPQMVLPKGELDEEEDVGGTSDSMVFQSHTENGGGAKRARTELPKDLRVLMQEVMNQDELTKPLTFIHNTAAEGVSGAEASALSKTAIYREKKKQTKTLDALMGQANLIYAKGHSAQALTMLLEVIRQEPRNADAYRQVAEIYREMGEGEQSLHYGMLAAYLDSKTPCEEWVDLAELARELNCLEMAAAAYGRASRIDPGLWLYWERRIELLEATNVRHLAMRARLLALQQTDYVRSSLDFDWFHTMVKMVAEYFIEINDEEKAVQSLETFVMRARQFGRSASSQHETLAGMWIGKGRYKEALKSILALCHDHLKVVDERGEKIVTVKLHGFAGYDVTPFPLPADARFEVDDEMPVTLMCKVAVCLINLGSKAPALNMCEIIMMRSYAVVEHVEPIAELAQAIYGAEWYAFGRRFLEQLQQWQQLSEEPQLWFVYGNCMAALKEFDRAMDAYERVLQLDPSHVDGRINLSGLLQRAGKLDAALDTLRDHDLEGCTHLPDERLLQRQAEFLFENNRTEAFIKTARMLLTPYFYEIHRNPDAVAKKRICKNTGIYFLYFCILWAGFVWALSTTLRQAALHAVQNSTLEKFVKRLGAATYQETNRSYDDMDAVALHDYCLKLIESLGKLNRYVDMLTVCCYAFLQPKITKDQKSITFQNLLYYCAIKAENWLLGFEYARWYHQTVNNSALFSLPEKEVVIKRIFNAMNYVFCHSQNVSYHRYVMRALVKNPGNHALQAISGNNSLITGTYRHALGEFLRVWVANKNNPLICMLIGLTFTHMACKKDLSSRHMLALRGLAFLRRYEQTRSVKQEVYYNLGRAFHQLSIFQLAVHFYEKTLETLMRREWLLLLAFTMFMPDMVSKPDHSPFSILHSCARDGRSTLTLALFHPQFGESSSVSLGNPTSIAHLDHLEEDQGRILIASCDLRSRKAPFKKTTSSLALIAFVKRGVTKWEFKRALGCILEQPPKVATLLDDGSEGVEVAQRYDMTRFAAHNLALLYQASGNVRLAMEMFVLAVLKDTISIRPHEFAKNVEETIERRINLRLANKVVPGLGLCVAFYDLLEDGLTLSVQFFEDIFIPADKLPTPSAFEPAEQIWHWQYATEEGQPPVKLYMDPGKIVRFKVVENVFKDVRPDLSEEEKRREKSYEIIGAMNETGLGCLAWWQTGQAEEGEEEEDDDEGEDREALPATRLDTSLTMANRVYIGRLSSRATERDVEHFFRGYGKLRDIVLKNGFGFIEFDSSRDADDAIYDLNGKELAGERVMLEFSRRGPRADAYGGRGGGGRDSFGARGGNRYGPPTKTRHRMIVENLSTHISWQDLKDMCRKYGEVTFADAHRDKKNEGMICFASRDDLKHCMDKMDGKDVNGRKIKLIDDSDDRGNSRSRSRSRGRSGSRSRSRTPRSRSRSPRGRDSRSRSKGSRSPRRDDKSRSRSRSASPKRDKRSRSATPKKRDDKSKSRSRSRSRSVSPKREKRSRSRSASREASRSRSPADRKSDKENSRSPSPEKMDD